MLYFRSYVLTAITVLLSACAVGPNFHSPPAPENGRITADSPVPAKTASARGPGGKSQYFLLNRDIPAEWWELYHSPELNELIEQGIKKSPNMAAAQAALRQARDNWWAIVGAGLFPAITGNAGAERQQASNVPGGFGESVFIFTLYNVTANVSYTLDVFGGIRRQIEAARAQIDFEKYQLEGTYLTLTSNIVTTAITEASLRAQIQATRKLIDEQEKILMIIRRQLGLGGVSALNVLTQQTLVAQTRATLPPLENDLAQTRNALAVLVGSLPGESDLPIFELEDLKLPTHLPVSLPSNLVRQRPDVQSSEALLHQASAQIGVATANLLPSFSLNGFWGTEADVPHDLFTADTGVWSYGISIDQPIFEGGSLIAKRRAAFAAYDQAAAQYRQTVLTAFQNVADTLRALEYDAKTLRAQAQAERSAYENMKLTSQQFKLGGVSYLTLLTAQTQYEQTVITRIQAQAARYSDTAALFQALGGGWWNRESLPKPPTSKMLLTGEDE